MTKLNKFREQAKTEFFAQHEPGMHPDNIFLTPFEENLLERLYNLQQKNTKNVKSLISAGVIKKM